MRRAVAAVGWVALAGACEQPRTELVARVDSEVAWGAGRTVQAVALTVRRGGPTGPLRSARTTALGTGSDRRPLPLTVGILPGDDIDTPIWIEALGCGDPNGCDPASAVVVQRAVVRFTRGRTEEVPLLLASACVGATCGSDERCGEGGRCEPATRAMVRPFGGVDAATVVDVAVDEAPADAGVVADGGIDAGGVDVAMVDLPAAETAPPFDTPTVDTAATCGALELLCGGRCVAVLRDPANCGGCGEACPAAAGATPTCVGGRCGFGCDATHADCDERPSNGCESAPATDHENCGGCGTACTDTQTCAGGVCVGCSIGQRWCAGSGCVDLANDARHCGTCETACGSTGMCRASTCVYVSCDAGMTPDAAGPPEGIVCPGSACRDIAYDRENCGRCGNVCPSSAPYCNNNSCWACPVVNHQQTYPCGGRCMDLGYDVANCGACGRACAVGRWCAAGTCVDTACPPDAVRVPAGTFTMGSTEHATEMPTHAVTLGAFCMGQTEIRTSAYRTCVTAGACTVPPNEGSCEGDISNWHRTDRESHPMNCLTWEQAAAYCAWRRGRLPTEAEWEYAARGSDGRRYPWGNTEPSSVDVPRRLCWARSSAEATCSTGSLAGDLSPFGMYDMGGNVFEWTADWNGPYSAGALTNPRGPTTGTQRIRRGGVWAFSSGPDVRASRRYAYLPTAGDFGVGVRCAWDTP